MCSAVNDWDPFRLSRELAEIEQRWARTERELAEGMVTVDPFRGREWPGLTSFQQVSELSLSDPLRLPLLRSIARLTDERIELPWLMEETRLLHHVRHPVREPREGSWSLRELFTLALMARGEERRLFLASRDRASRALGQVRLEILGRRVEVTRRLRLSRPDELSSPFEEEGLAVELAQALLDQTEEAASQLSIRSFPDYLGVACAETAVEAWPARLQPQSLRELLGSPEWFRGVNIEGLRLPERAAPSSFPLALSRLGCAWFVALAPRDLPWIVARDPESLLARREGYLWAFWCTKRAFLRRHLGLGPSSWFEHRRALLRMNLLEGRRLALAVLITAAVERGGEVLRARAEELSVRVFGEELSIETLLARRAVRRSAATEFAAFLSMFERDRALTEELDEDYFLSPRAIERFRDEAARVPALQIEPEIARAGQRAFLREIAEAF